MQLYFWDAFSEHLLSQCNIKLKAKLDNIFWYLDLWPMVLTYKLALDIFPPLGSPQSCYCTISLLRGHPGVQQHYGATWTILPIKECYIGHGKPSVIILKGTWFLLLCASLVIFIFSLVPIAYPLDIPLMHPSTEATEAHFFVQESSLTQRIQVPIQTSTSFQQESSWTHTFEICGSNLIPVCID